MREDCGLELINILDTLHNTSFQAQIGVWEEAQGQSWML